MELVTNELVFMPFVAPHFIIAAVLVALGLVVLAAMRGFRGALLRLVPVLLLALVLFNPRIVKQTGEPMADTVLLAVDNSPSQQLANRKTTTRSAADALEKKLNALPDTQVRRIEFGKTPNNIDAQQRADERKTSFGAIKDALNNIEPERLGGVFLITDGQVHDAPKKPPAALGTAPLHLLLTGSPDETDRYLQTTTTPAYGIVGETVDLSFVVKQSSSQKTPQQKRTTINDIDTAMFSVRLDGQEAKSGTVPLNTPLTITLPIEHAGANVVELSIEPKDGELSTINNKTAVVINGVRDRLRVLLVSGSPHIATRSWRNLLKSDPAVDLVQFIILRTAQSMFATSLVSDDDLALIPFPVHELFEDRLANFDLVIFDRFERGALVTPRYYANILSYLRAGGAILAATGPEFAGPKSLFDTFLKDGFAASPTGTVYQQEFIPEVTKTGLRHPITRALETEHMGKFGPWKSLVEATPLANSVVLLQGVKNAPLLITNRFGKGRMAMLQSDSFWLWERGYKGGGPHVGFLRRIAHWLMKEPDLEENRLFANLQNNALEITRQSFEKLATAPSATITLPDGQTRTTTLAEQQPGLYTASVDAAQMGLYRIASGKLTTVAVGGSVNSPEFSELVATDSKLAGAQKASGGATHWLYTHNNAPPEIRKVKKGRQTKGYGWAGIVANNHMKTTGYKDSPLVPIQWIALAVLLSLLLCWLYEGRQNV